MDLFNHKNNPLSEDYRGKGYSKGAKVKGAGTLPGDVNVMKGLFMPKPIKVNTKAAAKITVPGDVNVMKAAFKGVAKFNTQNVNKGNNAKSVSMANLPNSKKSNVASFGNKGPHNNTFSNNAVRDNQEHAGDSLWEAKKTEAKNNTKMKKEKPNDPISKTNVKAPWTKLTVPGDVAIGVKNQGKEYTAHTGPDYAKNSDYGKQRKVSYGSETKNFYDHVEVEHGKFEVLEGYTTGADVEATSRRLSTALGADKLKNKKTGKTQGSARDRLTSVMHKVKTRAGGGGGTKSQADTDADRAEARGHQEGWFAGRAKKRGGSLSRADEKDRQSRQRDRK